MHLRFTHFKRINIIETLKIYILYPDFAMPYVDLAVIALLSSSIQRVLKGNFAKKKFVYVFPDV